MSQLIWRSHITGHADKAEAVFPGTAVQSLGEALSYFASKTLDSAKRIVKMTNVPEVIANNARELLADPAAREFRYTVLQNPDGSFSIYESDGPDRYDLVD